MIYLFLTHFYVYQEQVKGKHKFTRLKYKYTKVANVSNLFFANMAQLFVVRELQMHKSHLCPLYIMTYAEELCDVNK